MPNAGKLKWEDGRLILEIDATLRVPIEIEVIEKTAAISLTLTRREGQTLDGILRGLINKEIASELHISVGTAKAYVSKVLAKFNVHGRGELMALFGKKRAGSSDA